MSITTEQLITAARKAGAWLAGRQTPLGNFVGNTEPDENGYYSDTDDISCYYKSTYFMRVIGETAAAARLMNYLTARFMTPEGDFRNSDEVRSTGSYVSGFCNLYSNSWAMRSAEAMHWHGLARRVLNFMLQFRTEQGGFYGGVQPPNTIIESNATGVGCVCALEGHEPEIAIQTGRFLLRMLDAQPEPESQFYIRMSDSQYIKPEPQEEYPIYYRIEKSEPLQAYWPWSWPMIAMIKLYRFTGQKEFLDGAIRIYDFFASCHEDAFHSPGSGKNSWASSMLYNITGDQRYRKTTMSQMEFILESQQADGFMLKPDCASFEDQPIRISYDFTPDYATWLVECAQELSSR